MDQKRQDIRLNTWECYQFYINKHIRPFFLPRRLTLSKLSPQHLQDYYNLKLKEGQSVNTLKKHHAILHGSLQEAFKKGLIPFNPADRVTFPRQSLQTRFRGTAYSLEQANQLLAAAEGDILKPAIILGLYYGLRKSEVLGLRWKDVDLESDTLTICNTVTRLKTLLEHEQTKSAASHRTLYVVPATKPYFSQLRQSQLAHQRLLGDAYTVSDHICVWPDGRSLSPDFVSQHFKRLLSKANLPHIRFHDLRHTAGSLLLQNGLSVKQVQEFLGHERSSTTLDIYAHIGTQEKMETATAMDDVLNLGCALEAPLED